MKNAEERLKASLGESRTAEEGGKSFVVWFKHLICIDRFLSANKFINGVFFLREEAEALLKLEARARTRARGRKTWRRVRVCACACAPGAASF